MSLLEVKELRRHFPVRKGVLQRTVAQLPAVDGVDLTIERGQTLGLVGESGCGKSTLGNCIVRADRPTSGQIVFEGRDIAQLTAKQLLPVRRELQIIFQDPYSSLNPRKRINETIAEPLRVHKIVPADQVDAEVERLLEVVGLTKGHKNRYPHEFSGGQRQRVGIARALAMRPKLIVCDEPVSALDVSIQAQVLNLLRDLQTEFDLTYLFISHGLGAVRYVSDRIAVMYLGKIVEVADTEEMFRAPRHPYTTALLEAYPIPDPLQRDRERIVLKGEIPNLLDLPRGCRFQARCPWVSERCRVEEPGLVGDAHQVACFNAKDPR